LKNRQAVSRGVRVSGIASDNSGATEILREENARRASQAVTRLYRDVRIGGACLVDELPPSDLPDEPMFDLGGYHFVRASRRAD
jgi:hypothetical protein